MDRVELLKHYKKLMDMGKATLQQQLDYCNLIATMINTNTEVGKKMFMRNSDKIKELTEKIKASKTVVLTDDNEYKNFISIYEADIKKGDIIEVYYKAGYEPEIIKVKNITFGNHYTSLSYLNKDRAFRMCINFSSGNKDYSINIKNIEFIVIIDRSIRSKKNCLADNTSISIIKGLIR